MVADRFGGLRGFGEPRSQKDLTRWPFFWDRAMLSLNLAVDPVIFPEAPVIYGGRLYDKGRSERTLSAPADHY
jgi:hypothetical protein